MAVDTSLTGVERFFEDDEIIVSKTNLKGRISYANNVFLRLSGMTEKETLGQPHSCIRNPNMPRCIFKLLWDTIQDGREIFAYVVNRSKNGDHYWVLAHVTPSRDGSGNVVGYHSNRRVAERRILDDTIIPLYKTLLEEERKHANSRDGLAASSNMITDLLNGGGVAYDEFIFSLSA